MQVPLQQYLLLTIDYLPLNPSRNKPRTAAAAAAAAQGSVPAHSITMGFALHVSSSHYDHIVLWSLTT